MSRRRATANRADLSPQPHSRTKPHSDTPPPDAAAAKMLRLAAACACVATGSAAPVAEAGIMRLPVTVQPAKFSEVAPSTGKVKISNVRCCPSAAGCIAPARHVLAT